MVDIKELKKKADIVRIIGSRIELKQVGSHYMACCPFHGEKTPSLKIDDRQGEWLWKCFGCQKGGDVISFIEQFDKVDSKRAIEKLAEYCGVNSEYHAQAKKVNETFQPVVKGNKQKAKTITLEQWAPKEKALAESQAAKDWLQNERGIDFETAKRLHLGFTQKHLFHIDDKHDQSIRDKGWISFPRIVGDAIVAVKYRSIAAKAFTQMADMNARALFNVETISPLEPIFVTEGELDACILEMAGYRAVSLPSAGVDINPEDKQLLKLAECIYLAGDNDGKVGTQYMQKLSRELASKDSRNVHLLIWPEGVKDANDFFRDQCNRSIETFYTEVQRAMADARNRPPENVEALIQLMRKSNDNDLENDPDRLRFPKELIDVDSMTYTPKGGVVVIYSTYSGTGKSMFKTQVLLHEAERGETVVDLSPEIRGPEYVSLVTSQTLGRNGETAKRTQKITEEQIHRAADLLDVPTEKKTDFRYYVGFDIPGTTEDEVLEFIRSTVALLGATRFAIDTFHRLIFASGKGGQTEAEGRMIKKIEAIGLELGCIFILICQSNAEAEGLQNLKQNAHGVLRGSREIRDVPAAIYLIHRNRRPQKDGECPDDILELVTGVFCTKTRYKGPGKPQVNLLLKQEWSLFMPYANDQAGGGYQEPAPAAHHDSVPDYDEKVF